MDIPLPLQAVLLGAVQGLTEFLPVSSTAHLAVAPRLLGWESPLLNSLRFDVALHAGTLAALLLALGPDWLRLVPALRRPRSRDGALGWELLLACVPAGLAALLLEDKVAGPLRGPLPVAAFLSAGALLLWWADERATPGTGPERAGFCRALAIGCVQAFAILPGLSRSGLTMTAAVLLGMSRPGAVRYSFLLSAPLLAAATGWEARHLAGLGTGELAALAAGTLAAAATGTLAIRWLLAAVARIGFLPFVGYRIVAASLLAAWAL